VVVVCGVVGGAGGGGVQAAVVCVVVVPSSWCGVVLVVVVPRGDGGALWVWWVWLLLLPLFHCLAPAALPQMRERGVRTVSGWCWWGLVIKKWGGGGAHRHGHLPSSHVTLLIVARPRHCRCLSSVVVCSCCPACCWSGKEVVVMCGV